MFWSHWGQISCVFWCSMEPETWTAQPEWHRCISTSSRAVHPSSFRPAHARSPFCVCLPTVLKKERHLRSHAVPVNATNPISADSPPKFSDGNCPGNGSIDEEPNRHRHTAQSIDALDVFCQLGADARSDVARPLQIVEYSEAIQRASRQC